MNKKRAQKVHACRRLYERFGISLNKEGYRQLVIGIRKQHYSQVRTSRTTLRVKFYKIPVGDGSFAYAVYDKLRHTVVTFLTQEMVERKIRS